MLDFLPQAVHLRVGRVLAAFVRAAVLEGELFDEPLEIPHE